MVMQFEQNSKLLICLVSSNPCLLAPISLLFSYSPNFCAIVQSNLSIWLIASNFSKNSTTCRT